MSLEITKPLLESGIINKATAQAINEALEAKLVEARESVRAELREEFAQRYDHDKTVMVEALDKMITDSLSEEIQDFHAEKQATKEDRVKAQMKLKESARKFNDFMLTKLAEEIGEFRKEHALQLEHRENLEQFVVQSLAKEIKDFAADKQAVVEAKVKLVAEGRKQLKAIKSKFVAESSAKLAKTVSSHLKGEILALKEDIQTAKENDFGRQIFESFASEYSTTHLNEKAETRKLMKQIAQKDRQLAESKKATQQAQRLVESKEREVRIIKESAARKTAMGDLLSTLNAERADTMKNLLEGVQTNRLKDAFDKYLPAVLNTSSDKKSAKTFIKESITEVTGDKTATTKSVEFEGRDNVLDIRRLAGLK